MKKKTIRIVIIGHVDHGKSTLIGRLLLDTNSLPREKVAEIKNISRQLGKETQLAYLADQLKEEREQNKTIDTTQIFFKTRTADYVIIDAPGHAELIKNMISGASLAQAAILIVDAQEGIKEQTTRHAFIARMLGIEKLIVVFNKMDLVNYDQKKFDEGKDGLTAFFTGLGLRPCCFIPISAKADVNITGPSAMLSWYRGQSLLEALENLKESGGPQNRPLRFCVQDVYPLGGERIVFGKVNSGRILRGQEVVIFPQNTPARIKQIKVFGRNLLTAREGENIGLVFQDGPAVQRGEVVIEKNNQPLATDRFQGNLFWMSQEPLEINRPFILRCATQEVGCHIEKVHQRINTSTLQVVAENASQLLFNEAGIVSLRTEKPLLMEKFSFIEELGRFVLERDQILQGAGVITGNFSE